VTVAAAAAEGHLFWITSRAAGVVALFASSAAVSAGLLMGGRMVKRRGVDLRAIHEALSLATLIALVVHALSLLGDAYLAPSLADIAIPFASGYQRWWMAAGIVGGWMLLVLGLSYYARASIGVARWRTLHRFTALAWLLGIGHALGMGTDAGTAWFVAGLIATAAPGIVLLGIRLAPAAAPAVRA
jgi:sulfoxide reductase heme-binding subunit YedZ